MSIIIAESINDLPDALKILKHEIYKKEATTHASSSDNSDKPKETSIEATPEIASIVDDLNKLNELKERLLTQEERLKLSIMDYMHLHGKLTFNDRCLVTWKSQNRNNFDLKSFKTDFPDMYDLYVKGSNSRIFRLC